MLREIVVIAVIACAGVSRAETRRMLRNVRPVESFETTGSTDGLKTHMLQGETGTMAFDDCEKALDFFFGVFVNNLDRDKVDMDVAAVCKPQVGGYSVWYHFFIEPLTESDEPYVDEYLAKHDGIVVRGQTFDFREVVSIELEGRLKYDWISAGGQSLTMRDRTTSQTVDNFGALRRWVHKANANIREPDIEAFLSFVGMFYGESESGYVKSRVLPEVHFLELTTTWEFRLEDGAVVPGVGRFMSDRDCREIGPTGEFCI